jgi:hypothetical protein
MKLIKVVLTILLFLPSAIFGQKSSIRFKKPVLTASQYQPVDIVFKVPKLPTENPILRLALNLLMKRIKLTIQGFYHGNGEYVLRFTPEKIGVFQYQTFSSVNALAGLRGTIKAEKKHKRKYSRFNSYFAENPQKMIYQDGKPYFALAFELDWLFALDKNNTNELPKTTEIIHSVKENGFNQVVMNVYAYDVGWKVPDNVPSQYSYKKAPYTVFKGTNENPDFSQLNTDFFNILTE